MTGGGEVLRKLGRAIEDGAARTAGRLPATNHAVDSRPAERLVLVANIQTGCSRRHHYGHEAHLVSVVLSAPPHELLDSNPAIARLRTGTGSIPERRGFGRIPQRVCLRSFR